MNFSNTYLDLGDQFYQKSRPTPVKNPKLLLWNAELAEQLKVATDLQQDPEALAQVFSGNQILSGSEPIAIAYAGHQFGNFNPQLGDGRAHLLGEIIDQSGQRWDLQLKGSGPTTFSRGGDGRCAIGPAVREFIMSEAMKALGVPTTQCLAVVTTGESVYRQNEVPGAVVTRVASSHLRVGTFEYFAARQDYKAIITLCGYAIDKHFPEISAERLGAQENIFVSLLDKVIEKQIRLIVEWMRVGFIHGVMNTDNTSIAGETIDFGPCAMMGVYDPGTVYSSIDHQGRYAFGNQPNIAHWNMARFAECLLLVMDEKDTASIEKIQSKIHGFSTRFTQEYLIMMGSKMGIQSIRQGDEELLNFLLSQFKSQKLDYTISFDLLTDSLTSESIAAQLKVDLGEVFESWRSRIDEQAVSIETIQKMMRQKNPVVIPRNHDIESVIQDCEKSGDPTTAKEFLGVLRFPYQQNSKTRVFQSTPVDGDEDYKTYCGT